MRSDTMKKGIARAPHRSLLYALGLTRDEIDRPLIANYIYGLGGRDASQGLIRDIFQSLKGVRSRGEVAEKVSFMGVRE